MRVAVTLLAIAAFAAESAGVWLIFEQVRVTDVRLSERSTLRANGRRQTSGSGSSQVGGDHRFDSRGQGPRRQGLPCRLDRWWDGLDPAQWQTEPPSGPTLSRDPAQFEVVYAIIEDWGGRTPAAALPFFSKINLREVANNLRARGFRVALNQKAAV